MSVAKTKLYYLENFLSYWQGHSQIVWFSFSSKILHLILFSSPRTFRDALLLQDNMITEFFFIQVLYLDLTAFRGPLFECKVWGMISPTWKGRASYWRDECFHYYQVTSGAMDRFTSRPRFRVFKVHRAAATCLLSAPKVHRCPLISQIGSLHLRTPFPLWLSYLPSRSLCF